MSLKFKLLDRGTYKDVEILSYEGHDDGYYWDYSVSCKVDDEYFELFHFGSFSGYIPTSHGVYKKDKPEFVRVFGDRNKGLPDELTDESVIDFCRWELTNFFSVGAKNSWCVSESDDYCGQQTEIDGVVVDTEVRE